MDAKLSLVKEAPKTDDIEEDQEPLTFPELLSMLAIFGGYAAVGLVGFLGLYLTSWALLTLHGLGLPWWVLLVFYSGLGGALFRLFRERERIVKGTAAKWDSYRAWATDRLPELWENLLSFGRKIRDGYRTAKGWVWAPADDTTSKETAA